MRAVPRNAIWCWSKSSTDLRAWLCDAQARGLGWMVSRCAGTTARRSTKPGPRKPPARLSSGALFFRGCRACRRHARIYGRAAHIGRVEAVLRIHVLDPTLRRPVGPASARRNHLIVIPSEK